MIGQTIIPPLSIIVCVDEAGGFGKDGKIPWNIPEDLKHFKNTTAGSVCIMGRKTYEDMYNMVMDRKRNRAKKPDNVKEPTEILPGRECYVITSNDEYVAHGATAVKSIRDAIYCLDEKDRRKVFIIGGEQMYREAFPFTETVYMSIVKDKTFQCDKKFPVAVLTKKFHISKGTQTDKLYHMIYRRNQK